YVAVNEWTSVVSVEIVNDAVPSTTSTTASVVRPSVNVIVPVGRPTAGGSGLTVASSVTAWPLTDGFGVVVRFVLVTPLFTVWVTIAEVLGANPASPP